MALGFILEGSWESRINLTVAVYREENRAIKSMTVGKHFG